MALATAKNLEPSFRCHTVDAALALVLAGSVRHIVCAVPPRDGGVLEKAGAEVIVARPEPAPPRRTVDRLIGRLADVGLGAREIARALELDSSEVTRKLRRRVRRRKSTE